MKRKLWTLLLALGAALALCVGASAADFLTGWDEVTNSTTTLESGKQYYLNNDVTVSQTITVRGTVTLDLNGHVLKYESANKGSVIVVENGGQLTIEDSNTSNLSPNSIRMANCGCWTRQAAQRPSPAASSPAARAIRISSTAQ